MYTRSSTSSALSPIARSTIKRIIHYIVIKSATDDDQ